MATRLLVTRSDLAYCLVRKCALFRECRARGDSGVIEVGVSHASVPLLFIFSVSLFSKSGLLFTPFFFLYNPLLNLCLNKTS